jgi:hypothetical protein
MALHFSKNGVDILFRHFIQIHNKEKNMKEIRKECGREKLIDF